MDGHVICVKSATGWRLLLWRPHTEDWDTPKPDKKIIIFVPNPAQRLIITTASIAHRLS